MQHPPAATASAATQEHPSRRCGRGRCRTQMETGAVLGSQMLLLLLLGRHE